jgi:hypothetical protein
MAEGVAVAGKVTGGGALDDRHNKPEADPVNAPHGWAWDRPEARWRPAKKRGNYARKSAGDIPSDGLVPSARLGGPDQPREPQRSDGNENVDRGTSHDPDPGWFGSDDDKPRTRKQTIRDVPQSVQNDIAGFAGLVGAPVLALLQQADPYCGGALAANYEPIIDAVLPLLCRSEKIVAYFTGDKSDWMLWGKLAMALAPVGKAVLDHHVLRRVDVVRNPDTGQVQVVPRRPGGSEHGDHLQPQPQPDYVA